MWTLIHILSLLSYDKRVSNESNEEAILSREFPYAFSESELSDRDLNFELMRSRAMGGR